MSDGSAQVFGKDSRNIIDTGPQKRRIPAIENRPAATTRSGHTTAKDWQPARDTYLKTCEDTSGVRSSVQYFLTGQDLCSNLFCVELWPDLLGKVFANLF
jgi:hypothetical protein